MPVSYVNIKSVRRIIITLVTVVAAVDSVREQILCNFVLSFVVVVVLWRWSCASYVVAVACACNIFWASEKVHLYRVWKPENLILLALFELCRPRWARRALVPLVPAGGRVGLLLLLPPPPFCPVVCSSINFSKINFSYKESFII